MRLDFILRMLNVECIFRTQRFTLLFDKQVQKTIFGVFQCLVIPRKEVLNSNYRNHLEAEDMSWISDKIS